MTDKPTPRCETCPFWTAMRLDGNGKQTGRCHNMRASARFTSGDGYTYYADWWCSEHPDAPPTRMETQLGIIAENLAQLEMSLRGRP